MNRIALVAFLWALLTFNVQAQESTQQQIKIGVVFGFTGAAQVWSQYGRMGLELAQDEINSSGGINGKQIELVFEDSKSNPTQSVAAYRKLTKIDQTGIVVGDVWDFLTNPLIPLAERDKVILFSPTVMPNAVERTNDYFFTMGERRETLGSAVDLFFKRNPDVKRVGIFCWDDPWGQSYLRIWQDVAEKNGVTIESVLCTMDFNNDFRADVTKMAAKRLDAVIIAHMANVVLQRMKEQKLLVKVLTTSNVVEDIKIKQAPKELFEGIYLTDWKPNEEFVQKFRARFNKDPVVEAHNSYETLRSIAKALKSSETDTVEALRTIKYDGVAGQIDFTGSSFANKSTAQLYRVQNGNFELVH
jgi:branched-chain amino acid transport system substrate-binding protein